eukprot:gene6813-7582_t
MEVDATQQIENTFDEDSFGLDQTGNQKVADLIIRKLDLPCQHSFPIFEGKNIIGRHENADIHVAHKPISKKHACIEVLAGQHFIMDYGSKNKTRRGKLILRPNVMYELTDQCFLTFADVECEYIFDTDSKVNETAYGLEASQSLFADNVDSDDEETNLVPSSPSIVYQTPQVKKKQVHHPLKIKNEMDMKQASEIDSNNELLLIQESESEDSIDMVHETPESQDYMIFPTQAYGVTEGASADEEETDIEDISTSGKINNKVLSEDEIFREGMSTSATVLNEVGIPAKEVEKLPDIQHSIIATQDYQDLGSPQDATVRFVEPVDYQAMRNANISDEVGIPAKEVGELPEVQHSMIAKLPEIQHSVIAKLPDIQHSVIATQNYQDLGSSQDATVRFVEPVDYQAMRNANISDEVGIPAKEVGELPEVQHSMIAKLPEIQHSVIAKLPDIQHSVIATQNYQDLGSSQDATVRFVEPVDYQAMRNANTNTFSGDEQFMEGMSPSATALNEVGIPAKEVDKLPEVQHSVIAKLPDIQHSVIATQNYQDLGSSQDATVRFVEPVDYQAMKNANISDEVGIPAKEVEKLPEIQHSVIATEDYQDLRSSQDATVRFVESTDHQAMKNSKISDDVNTNSFSVVDQCTEATQAYGIIEGESAEGEGADGEDLTEVKHFVIATEDYQDLSPSNAATVHEVTTLGNEAMRLSNAADFDITTQAYTEDVTSVNSEAIGDEVNQISKRRRKRNIKLSSNSESKRPRLSRGSIENVENTNVVPKIMFTGLNNKKLEQCAKKLGMQLTESVTEATHLVTDKVRRTVKFLCCLSRGIHIVYPKWLEECRRMKKVVCCLDFVVKDEESENQFQFDLQRSLETARTSQLLKGWNIFVSKNVKPSPQQMKGYPQPSGHQVTPNPSGHLVTPDPSEYQVLVQLPKRKNNKTLVISCVDDQDDTAKLSAAGQRIYSAELILSGSSEPVHFTELKSSYNAKLAIIGRPITIDCSVNNNNVKVDLFKQTQRSKVKVAVDGRIIIRKGNAFTLMISSYANSSRYFCHGKLYGTVYEKAVVIHVIATAKDLSPRPEIFPGLSKPLVGQAFSLRCTAPGHLTVIRWYKNGKQIQNGQNGFMVKSIFDDKVNSVSSTLSKKKATISNSGKYRCAATTRLEQSFMAYIEAKVAVKGNMPLTWTSNANVNLLVADSKTDAIIDCSLSRPDDSVDFYVEDKSGTLFKILKGRGRYGSLGKQKIIIHSVSTADMGVYVCKASGVKDKKILFFVTPERRDPCLLFRPSGLRRLCRVNKKFNRPMTTSLKLHESKQFVLPTDAPGLGTGAELTQLNTLPRICAPHVLSRAKTLP